MDPCLSHRHLLSFFNDTATTEIYTLSLHDALPILVRRPALRGRRLGAHARRDRTAMRSEEHTSELQSRVDISYAGFCLKKESRQRPGREAASGAVASRRSRRHRHL